MIIKNKMKLERQNFSATLMFPESYNVNYKDLPICPICKKYPLFPVKIAIDRGIGEFYDRDKKNHVSTRRIIIEQTVWLCELSCDIKKLVDELII